MASTSNLPVDANQYLYASITNVSNFVSVKLSGNNYLLWKAQMLCLMESHDMRGILDDTFASPEGLSKKIEKQYDSLLKGWIFGSISEDVLVHVVNLSSAKAVWEKLNSIYDPSLDLEQEEEEIDEVAPETNPNHEDSHKMEMPEDGTKTKGPSSGRRWRLAMSMINFLSRSAESVEEILLKNLSEATIVGDWSKAESILVRYKYLATKEISQDGSMILHTAVGIGHNDFVKNLCYIMSNEGVLGKRGSDGSTALHIAAIVGNTFAAVILVRKNKDLLRVKDQKGEDPLHKAYENMHTDTIGFLLKAVIDDGKSGDSLRLSDSVHLNLHRGVEIVVNAITAKQYDLASELVGKFPEFAWRNDKVLMAIAKTFPHGLGYVETLIYPSLDNIPKRIYSAIEFFLKLLIFLPLVIVEFFRENKLFNSFSASVLLGLLLTVPCWLVSVFVLIYILILMVCFLFVMFYYILWKGITILGGPTKHIEKRKKEWGEAIKILELVCDEIDKLKLTGTGHSHYTRPILEAASQNAYKVVDEILLRSPVAIHSADVEGYDIIQLSIIHRSEKVYNLIYEIGERKNRYRTILDSSKNNIVHLAGRLAPPRELQRRRGAAFQLQRDLQWREEVKKHVFPSYISQENNSKETPDMVFTREHEKLLNEGEKWMKTTAESCSIIAALITTIVFAAAITVPGGNDDKNGIPLFTNNATFIVFAVSDAISLFSSSTALLAFLSIMSSRFSEIDFLVSLPSRMLIGIFSLLLSTIAMMVAFSATLLLVFCHEKIWMLLPTCVLAFIPVGFIAALQFPIIVDLLWSTHISVFGYQRKSAVRRFNPNNIQSIFHK